MAIGNRDYTAGKFMLELGGNTVGYLKKFSGLDMEGDIVTNDLGPDNVQMKNMANIKWTPAKCTVGVGMAKDIYDWMEAAFKKSYRTMEGAFTVADFNGRATSRIDFYNALITGITVPKLDGSSKEAAYFDVEFEPDQVRWSKEDGREIRAPASGKQKSWLCCNFRVEIDGLPCDRVASVDSFTWKCGIVSNPIGIFREATKHPAKVTVPDLKLSISHADYHPWSLAAKRWFVDGNHVQKNHLHGRIVFLAPNMKDEIGEINLDGVGFKKFTQESSEANAEKIKRFTVELYVETMRLKMFLFDK